MSITEPQFKQCFVVLGDVDAADSDAPDEVESSFPAVTFTSVDISDDLDAGSLVSSGILMPPDRSLSH